MQRPPIKLIENHDEAYKFWKKLRIQGKPLLHLDAHIDFNFHPAKPLKQTFEEAKSKKELIQQLSTNLMYKEMNIKEMSLTNIGNYIYPAMREGMVTDFYWVIPGNRQEFRKSLGNLRNITRSLFRRDPFERRKITKQDGMLKARIYGRDFIVTTLEDLPSDLNGVLLDIDTDYLTTDSIRKAGAAQDAGKRFPWIWPEELVSRLKEKKISPACVTIAYSVNGGFTPIIYKFLGDEVAIFFNGADSRLKELIAKKNTSFAFFKKGKIDKAIGILKETLQKLDTIKRDTAVKSRLKANIAFILFRCYTKAKNFNKAKFYYNLAVLSDETYRVRDNNYGPLLLRGRRSTKKAEEEFKIILSSDRNNPDALSGLANIFMRRRNSKKAKVFFNRVRALNKKNRDALLGLGQAELGLKNYRKALEHLEDYKSKNRLDGFAYSLSAAAYEGMGRFDKALEEFKFAHRFGMELGLYLRLFRLLKKTGVPEEHKKWIEKRINTYKDYKKSFLKPIRNRRLLRSANTRTRKRTKLLLNRIDKMLKYVK